jgi:deoxyxylulose-5-phosphate synthase
MLYDSPLGMNCMRKAAALFIRQADIVPTDDEIHSGMFDLIIISMPSSLTIGNV